MSYKVALHNIDLIVFYKNANRSNFNFEVHYEKVLFEIRDEDDVGLLILLIPHLLLLKYDFEVNYLINIFDIINEKINAESIIDSIEHNEFILESLITLDIHHGNVFFELFYYNNPIFFEQLNHESKLEFYLTHCKYSKFKDNRFIDDEANFILKSFGDNFLKYSEEYIFGFKKNDEWNLWRKVISSNNADLYNVFSFDKIKSDDKIEIDADKYIDALKLIFGFENLNTFYFFMDFLEMKFVCKESNKTFALYDNSMQLFINSKIERLSKVKIGLFEGNLLDFLKPELLFGSNVNNKMGFYSPFDIKLNDLIELYSNDFAAVWHLSKINNSDDNCFDKNGFLLESYKIKNNILIGEDVTIYHLIDVLLYSYKFKHFLNEDGESKGIDRIEEKGVELSNFIVDNFKNNSFTTIEKWDILNKLLKVCELRSVYFCYSEIVNTISESECLEYIIKNIDHVDFTFINVVCVDMHPNILNSLTQKEYYKHFDSLKSLKSNVNDDYSRRFNIIYSEIICNNSFNLITFIEKDINCFFNCLDDFLELEHMINSHLLSILKTINEDSLSLISNHISNTKFKRKKISISNIIYIINRYACFSAYKYVGFIIDYISENFFIDIDSFKNKEMKVDINKIFLGKFKNYDELFLTIDKLNKVFLSENVDIYDILDFDLPFDVDIKKRKSIITPNMLSQSEMMLISKYNVDLNTIMIKINEIFDATEIDKNDFYINSDMKYLLDLYYIS